MSNNKFISETEVAYKKIITRSGCNRVLYFLMHKLGRSVANTISLRVFNFYHKYAALKTFKLVLTYTNGALVKQGKLFEKSVRRF